MLALYFPRPANVSRQAAFLDESMTYTSAMYDAKAAALSALASHGSTLPEESLANAQRRKRQAMLDKALATVRADGVVLDIGCGWGSLALDGLERSEVRSVVGVSNSRNHVALCRERARRAGTFRRLGRGWSV